MNWNNRIIIIMRSWIIAVQGRFYLEETNGTCGSAHSIAKVICPGAKRNDGYLEGGGLFKTAYRLSHNVSVFA